MDIVMNYNNFVIIFIVVVTRLVDYFFKLIYSSLMETIWETVPFYILSFTIMSIRYKIFYNSVGFAPDDSRGENNSPMEEIGYMSICITF